MFLFVKGFALLTLICSSSLAKQATFQDVTLLGYQVLTHKFEHTIISADNLKNEIPENVAYDALEISNANIPILRENSVTDLEDLDELILINSAITEIQPGAFKNLPSLRKINLESNKLEEIVVGVFNEMAVSIIDLQDNKLTRIETAAFNNMPNLNFINLAGNKLATWNRNWFAHDPLLTRIAFRHNKIETLPWNAFKNLAADKYWGTFQLKLYLDFSYNKINSLTPEVFAGLYKIGGLYLDHNELTSLEADLLENVDVEYLSFNDNHLTCLPGDLSHILKARMTSIDGNPWNCTCLENIKDWAKKTDSIVQLSYSDMNCYAQRIGIKTDDLQKRLNEIRNQ